MEFPLTASGALDIGKVDPLLRDAAEQWIANFIPLYEGGRQLGAGQIVNARIELPSDRSFETWESALAGVNRPRLPDGTELFWQQAMLDVQLEYSIGSDRSRFSIEPALARLGIRTMTVLRFLPPGTGERIFQYTGDPGLVRLDPRWHQAVLRFVKLGFSHIMDGLDHLLFVFCLVIPFRRFRSLVAVITSFTVAHSITLIASAMGLAPSGAVVSATDRDADRDFDRVHGLREHRGPQAGTALADRVRVRAGARLRLFVHPARVAPVRGRAPDDIAAGVQCGRRARVNCWWWQRPSRCWPGCSDTSWPSGWARSCCLRWWRTRPGTGCWSAGRRCASTDFQMPPLDAALPGRPDARDYAGSDPGRRGLAAVRHVGAVHPPRGGRRASSPAGTVSAVAATGGDLVERRCETGYSACRKPTGGGEQAAPCAVRGGQSRMRPACWSRC